MPLKVRRLRETYEDHESNEDDVDVPVDDNVEHLDVVDKVEGLLIYQR